MNWISAEDARKIASRETAKAFDAWVRRHNATAKADDQVQRLYGRVEEGSLQRALKAQSRKRTPGASNPSKRASRYVAIATGTFPRRRAA